MHGLANEKWPPTQWVRQYCSTRVLIQRGSLDHGSERTRSFFGASGAASALSLARFFFSGAPRTLPHPPPERLLNRSPRLAGRFWAHLDCLLTVAGMPLVHCLPLVGYQVHWWRGTTSPAPAHPSVRSDQFA